MGRWEVSIFYWNLLKCVCQSDNIANNNNDQVSIFYWNPPIVITLKLAYVGVGTSFNILLKSSKRLYAIGRGRVIFLSFNILLKSSEGAKLPKLRELPNAFQYSVEIFYGLALWQSRLQNAIMVSIFCWNPLVCLFISSFISFSLSYFASVGTSFCS